MLNDRPWLSMVSCLAMVLGSCASAVEKLEAEPPFDDSWEFSYIERGRDGTPALDLRSLNEPIAGQSGFVRLSADGNSFVLGDGTPARFWAVGSELFKEHTEDEVKRHVKFLARMGVNMVRIHSQINPVKGKLTDVNETEIDGIWKFVAAAKRQGIYCTISPYWASRKDATRWGIDGYPGEQELWGLLFFDETLQKGYKAWAAALYARPNPYTGIPLSEDASVAIIQVQNEDSLLFWTLDNCSSPKPASQRLATKYADWTPQEVRLARRGHEAGLGTDSKRSRATTSPKDDRRHVRRLWELLQKSDAGKSEADRRSARIPGRPPFSATSTRRIGKPIYRQTTLRLPPAYQRLELEDRRIRCGWDDVERWTYAATDVIARQSSYLQRRRPTRGRE